MHERAPPLAEYGLTYLDGSGNLWKVVITGALSNQYMLVHTLARLPTVKVEHLPSLNLQAKPRVRVLTNMFLYIVACQFMIPSLNNPPPIGFHCSNEENN
jgi:hypothetical protein